jgi:hypothetical protein
MNAFTPCLAALTHNALINRWLRLENGVQEKILLFAAVGCITALLLVWALFIRRRRGQRAHYHYPSAKAPVQNRDADETDAGHSHRKSRRRRRHHRRRNPTLAETGGLPPLRSQEPPETAF